MLDGRGKIMLEIEKKRATNSKVVAVNDVL